jgi:hypothetical protein
VEGVSARQLNLARGSRNLVVADRAVHCIELIDFCRGVLKNCGGGQFNFLF